jgi:hypothetical protein
MTMVTVPTSLPEHRKVDVRDVNRARELLWHVLAKHGPITVPDEAPGALRKHIEFTYEDGNLVARAVE